jgi:hypothetical protein
MRTTHTVTGEEVTFADPFKICCECGGWVTGYIEFPDSAGLPSLNAPCEHEADYRSICPSWGPVDGCKCLAGEHPAPPKETDDATR